MFLIGVSPIAVAPKARLYTSLGQRPRNRPYKPIRAEGPIYQTYKDVSMPQSLSAVFVHMVFSTKDHEPILGETFRSNLHAYIATVARNLDCECYRVGGVADHIHLLIRLSRTITLASLVEKLKTSSSKWIKTQAFALTGFSWQRGYGVFSISPADLDDLYHYIDSQNEHHRIHSFQEEYRTFLAKYQIEYDERYVWD